MERLLLQEASDGSFTLVLPIPGPRQVRNNRGKVREVTGTSKGERASAPPMHLLPGLRSVRS
eukprot:398450-Alexandrium_andersonii.AAC.1